MHFFLLQAVLQEQIWEADQSMIPLLLHLANILTIPLLSMAISQQLSRVYSTEILKKKRLHTILFSLHIQHHGSSVPWEALSTIIRVEKNPCNTARPKSTSDE